LQPFITRQPNKKLAVEQLDPLEEEKARQTWQAQALVRVCWECLAEPSARDVFNSHLRESFDQIPGDVGDSGPCSPHLLSMLLYVVAAVRSAVPVAVAIPEPGGGHRQ
ncbi:hypothetical protein CRENBAI_014112, partial [Crenichthys baileyi]